MPPSHVRIGISACLLGREVRFDGGHKRNLFLTDTLGGFVEWVPVCPEVEAGFGTPREPMRLVRADGRMILQTVQTGRDVTERLERCAARRVEELEQERLSGFVLKKDSPSCGMEHVNVYGRKGPPSRTGQGLFATALRERFPSMPLEEEGRLADPQLRDNFIERIFAYRRLQELFAGRLTIGKLIRFHTAHKLTLMAHSVTAYRSLGRLVAGTARVDRHELEQRYTERFMRALEAMATPRSHTNVLQHVAGYFKALLGTAESRELRSTIEDYRRGLVPLIVPMALLRQHVGCHNVEYLAGQVYLYPHPSESVLRDQLSSEPPVPFTPTDHHWSGPATPRSGRAPGTRQRPSR